MVFFEGLKTATRNIMLCVGCAGVQTKLGFRFAHQSLNRWLANLLSEEVTCEARTAQEMVILAQNGLLYFFLKKSIIEYANLKLGLKIIL